MITGLDDLIKKIKEEGVEEAKRHSQEIIEEAKKKAEGIIEKAKQEAENIIYKAEEESRRLRTHTEEALNQAYRDAVLSLRQSITELFDRVINRCVSEQLSSKNLRDIIIKIVENFRKDKEFEIEFLLSRRDKEELEKIFLASFKNELKKGVTFKVSDAIKSGFRIGQKGKDFYYDFTDEAVAEALREYLNPRINEILKATAR